MKPHLPANPTFKNWYKALQNDAFDAAFGALMYTAVFVGLVLLLRWVGADPLSSVDSIVGAGALGVFTAWRFGHFTFRSCRIQLTRARHVTRPSRVS